MVITTNSNSNSTMLLDLNTEVTLDPPFTHKRNCRLRGWWKERGKKIKSRQTIESTQDTYLGQLEGDHFSRSFTRSIYQINSWINTSRNNFVKQKPRILWVSVGLPSQGNNAFLGVQVWNIHQVTHSPLFRSHRAGEMQEVSLMPPVVNCWARW